MMVLTGAKTMILGRVAGAADVGKTPLGLRSNISVDWTVTGKELSASMKTTDYLLTRPDGISVINSLGVMTTDDNQRIAVKLGGYGLVPVNGKMKLKGFVTFETASERYSSYNSRIEVFEGEFATSTGEIALNSFELGDA